MLSWWTVNVILNKVFQVPLRNDIFVREIILFFSVMGVQGAFLVETPCEILPYCSFHADIVVHYTQTGHNVQVTGQDLNPIITQYMFVEQETEERGCIGSWWGNRRERDQWGDLGVDGWIILGRISRRLDVGIWTGLGWLSIETGGGRL